MARKKEGVSNRTVNLDVLVLSNFLRWAKKMKKVRAVVTDEWEALPYRAPKRELVTLEDLQKIYDEALRVVNGKPVHETGVALVDYLKLMQFSGARRDSALAVQWEDVNWEKKQLWLRKTKYNKTNVYVDFNSNLEAHLLDMQTRRVGENKFLFPSRVNLNTNVTSMKEVFTRVRVAAGLPDFNLHDLRHFFISQCVMAGIDFMTIAHWVGHADGGVLIGKVYGHLSNEHRQAAAAKVSLTGQQAPVELVPSAPRNIEPAVEPQTAEPAGATPVPDRRTTDAGGFAPTGEGDGVNHFALSGFMFRPA